MNPLVATVSETTKGIHNRFSALRIAVIWFILLVEAIGWLREIHEFGSCAVHFWCCVRQQAHRPIDGGGRLLRQHGPGRRPMYKRGAGNGASRSRA
ncbi:hypothetical protein I545_6227 [Mycobacterium kansasii 662]|uniref:Uncharacterized protein n=1 Tax=Mycobacterium kansasii 662 TaxID=1299326 RepID=X7YPD8_MYCKA|nr:hypothetical protein I547_2269 [Mycobacterium kansasii 824]EUA08250.1 hypothetical protein I545_6227 [Mycobacterium kansasii 662]